MFETRWLDKVSRVHPLVPLFLFVPAIVAMLVLGFANGVGAMAAVWILGGYLVWTLTEYTVWSSTSSLITGSARDCTGSCTACTTIIRTTLCAW